MTAAVPDRSGDASGADDLVVNVEITPIATPTGSPVPIPTGSPAPIPTGSPVPIPGVTSFPGPGATGPEGTDWLMEPTSMAAALAAVLVVVGVVLAVRHLFARRGRFDLF